MNSSREKWVRVVVAVLLAVVGAVIVWRVRGAMVTVLLAVVGAYVLRPAVDWLCRVTLRTGRRSYHLPRGIATFLVFILVGLVLWGFWTFTALSIGREIADLQSHWQDYREVLGRWAANADRYYREQLPVSLRPTVDSWVKGAGDALSRVATKGLGLTVHGVGFVIEMALVPILTFYFLADGPNIRKQALFLIPRSALARTEETLDQADRIFQRYIRAQVILCLIALVVVTAGLWAIRVDSYLLLGVVAGLTRAVPIVGPVIGAIPIVIVVLVTKSTAVTLWVLALFSLMHLLESKLLMPAVLGQQLDLHPVLIIVALLIGAQMGGVLGVFLAAPVLAAVKGLIAEQRRRQAAGG